MLKLYLGTLHCFPKFLILVKYSPVCVACCKRSDVFLQYGEKSGAFSVWNIVEDRFSNSAIKCSFNNPEDPDLLIIDSHFVINIEHPLLSRVMSKHWLIYFNDDTGTTYSPFFSHWAKLLKDFLPYFVIDQLDRLQARLNSKQFQLNVCGRSILTPGIQLKYQKKPLVDHEVVELKSKQAGNSDNWMSCFVADVATQILLG